MNLQQAEWNTLWGIVTQALAESSESLSQMTTGEIRLQDPRLSFIPLRQVPGIAGGPAAVVLAVYLRIEGEITGHVMMIFSPESARGLADLLLNQPIGTCTELDDMARSALAEAGNICGSAFMNAIADRTGLAVKPTPPLVVEDMAGAILESVVADLLINGDEALVIETSFNGALPGHLLLMPDTRSMVRLITALEAIR